MRLFQPIGTASMLLLTASVAFSQPGGIHRDMVMTQEGTSASPNVHQDGSVLFASKRLEAADKGGGQRYPDLALSLYYGGLDAARNDRCDIAIEMLTKAISEHPHFPEAYVARGCVRLWFENEHRLAVDDHTKAIRLRPGWAYAYFHRADTYWDAGHCQKALADCDMGIRLDPGFAAGYALRARVHRDLGHQRQSREDEARAKQLAFSAGTGWAIRCPWDVTSGQLEASKDTSPLPRSPSVRSIDLGPSPSVTYRPGQHPSRTEDLEAVPKAAWDRMLETALPTLLWGLIAAGAVFLAHRDRLLAHRRLVKRLQKALDGKNLTEAKLALAELKESTTEAIQQIRQSAEKEASGKWTARGKNKVNKEPSDAEQGWLSEFEQYEGRVQQLQDVVGE